MIHHQNGYQKSQDTVVLFAKSELTKHVVSGGFLHLNMHGINSIVLCRLLVASNSIIQSNKNDKYKKNYTLFECVKLLLLFFFV